MVNKVAKSFSIDIDIVDRLNQEENASDLVNTLLQRHYFDLSYTEKSLEEKLKEAELIENQIIKERDEERKRIQQEIDKLKEQEREMAKRQQEEIDKNIELIESSEELCQGMINEMTEKWDPVRLLDYVSKFRVQGIRIGVRQLKAYLGTKGITEPVGE